MKFGKRWLWLTAVLLIVVTGCRSQETQNNSELPTSYSYAQGALNYPVTLNQITMQNNNTQVVSAEADGNPGFAYVVLNVTLVNQTADPIVPADLELVDNFGNVYVYRQPSGLSFANQLQIFPAAVNRGDSITGNAVFLVPVSALPAGLNLRWESELHEARIDIALGQLALP